MFFREPENRGIDQRLFENILNINEECPYHNHLDIYITALEKGVAYLETPLEEKHMNPMAIVHGGLTFSLGDTAMGMAIRTTNYDVVTVDSQCYFMHSARVGDTLKGIGRVVKLGKTIIVAKAEILTQNNVKIAMMSGTFYNRGKVLDLD